MAASPETPRRSAQPRAITAGCDPAPDTADATKSSTQRWTVSTVAAGMSSGRKPRVNSASASVVYRFFISTAPLNPRPLELLLFYPPADVHPALLQLPGRFGCRHVAHGAEQA